MSRYVVKTSLFAAAIVAVSVALVALYFRGGNDPAAWATVSATLAVVAAVFSAWTSQRVIELQEDAMAPNPVPWLDMRSRYNLGQFRISNRGGSAAYNVRIKWAQPLENPQRAPIVLGVNSPIPTIGPGDDASVMLGLTHEYMHVFADTTRSGVITFEDATGTARSRPFVVSAEHERVALSYDDERVRTEYELQKIPELLKKIANELHTANELKTK